MFFDRSFSKEPAENFHVVPFALTPMLSGDLFEAERRKGRPVDGRQAGNELERLVTKQVHPFTPAALPKTDVR